MAKKATAIANYSIRAAAGCGKSTTLVWTESKVPKGIKPSDQQLMIFDSLREKKKAGRSVRVACFNTAIMHELEPQFPGADVRNNHKIGYHATTNYLGIKPKFGFVKGDKYNKIAHEVIGNPYNDQSLWPVITSTIKLVDLARSTLAGNRLASKSQSGETAERNNLWEVSQDELLKMAAFYNMDIEDLDSVQYVEDIINIGIKRSRECFDFTDQIFLPNVFGCKPPKVHRCYIDEMQDLNAAQHGLLHDTAEQFVVVGDIYQSIYGFAGADPESMPRFEQYAQAKLLPLTITRRCPHSHVALAKRFLPDDFGFAAAPTAKEGTVIKCKFDVEFYKSLEGKDNLCLSRTNAPMVQACFLCWKNNIPALIRGRNIAKNLADTIKRMKASNNADLAVKLIEYYEPKIETFKALDKADMAAAKQDELDLLMIFVTETKNPDECVNSIYKMFDDETSKERAIQFSTIHKAKGLEADHVAVLTPDLLPHPGICRLGPFWTRQEMNIAYVCYTRGKDTLYLNQRESRSY
jgi:superfamily I DNA/RNA helicase